MLRVRLPWSARPWALPFLTVRAPSERANHQAGRGHKTTVNWTGQRVKAVSGWLKRPGVLVGDGAYACLELAWTCVQQEVVLVSRLRLEAPLEDFPAPLAPGRRGRKPQTGARLPRLATRLTEARQRGLAVELPWYGGERRRVRLLSGVALWDRAGQPPLPLRWVLVAQAPGDPQPAAFFGTCTACTPRTIVMAFVRRWNVEVTLEEARRHLGLQTQRQWSAQAIARTTPVLLGLFSLVCLLGERLTQGVTLPPRLSAWHTNPTPAPFSDVLACLRRVLGAGKYFHHSTSPPEPVILPAPVGASRLEQRAATV